MTKGICRNMIWKRRLKARVMRIWQTLSSCRRTRPGIRVSFRPSTVKWFSASLSWVKLMFVLEFMRNLDCACYGHIWNPPSGSRRSSFQEVCTRVARCRERQQQGSHWPSTFPADRLKSMFCIINFLYLWLQQPLTGVLESIDEVAAKNEVELLARQLILLVTVPLIGSQVLKTLLNSVEELIHFHCIGKIH